MRNPHVENVLNRTGEIGLKVFYEERLNLFTAVEGRKKFFRERTKILDGFLENFSRTKVEQPYSCCRQK